MTGLQLGPRKSHFKPGELPCFKPGYVRKEKDKHINLSSLKHIVERAGGFHCSDECVTAGLRIADAPFKYPLLMHAERNDADAYKCANLVRISY